MLDGHFAGQFQYCLYLSSSGNLTSKLKKPGSVVGVDFNVFQLNCNLRTNIALWEQQDYSLSLVYIITCIGECAGGKVHAD